MSIDSHHNLSVLQILNLYTASSQHFLLESNFKKMTRNIIYTHVDKCLFPFTIHAFIHICTILYTLSTVLLTLNLPIVED